MAEKQPVPREQKIALAILGLIGLYMLYSNFFAPMGGKITAAEKKLSDKESELLEMRPRAAEINVLQEELKLYEELLAETEDKLPVSEELPQFIRSITALAARYDMDLRVLNMLGVEQGEYYNSHVYGMRLVSDYHNLARFFAELGQMERIMNVKNLSMEPFVDGENEYDNLLEANFQLVAFTFKK
ncbi:MAG: type 4a pilus biogenesis protein PilO [Elusimicrobia bacterium]|nr:type 4a pilus biogenesis protein PilO [Elusimicrobiota bacterium]